MTAYLCVGGPYAGQWKELPEGHNHFRVAERPPRTQHYADIVEVEAIEYCIQSFHSPSGSLKVWAPRNQTPLKTMELLLETYENPWMDRHGQAATPRRT